MAEKPKKLSDLDQIENISGDDLFLVSDFDDGACGYEPAFVDVSGDIYDQPPRYRPCRLYYRTRIGIFGNEAQTLTMMDIRNYLLQMQNA